MDDEDEVEPPKLKPVLFVELPPKGFEESDGANKEVVELLDTPDCVGLLSKFPNPEDDVELPNGVELVLPNVGTVLLVVDAAKGLEVPVPPNIDPELVPNKDGPVVVGAVEAVADPPNPPNFDDSTFCSDPNDNLGGSDENIPRFAGTPPSVVVVPVSEGNWIGFSLLKSDGTNGSAGLAENKLLDDREDPVPEPNKLAVVIGAGGGTAALLDEGAGVRLLPNMLFFVISDVVETFVGPPNERVEETLGSSAAEFDCPNNGAGAENVGAVAPKSDEAGAALVVVSAAVVGTTGVSFFPKILEVIPSVDFEVPNRLLLPKSDAFVDSAATVGAVTSDFVLFSKLDSAGFFNSGAVLGIIGAAILDVPKANADDGVGAVACEVRVDFTPKTG